MMDELYVHEILRALYPEEVKSDEDQDFDKSIDFASQELLVGDHETTMAEFLHRLLLLVPPVESTLTGTEYHALVEGGVMLARRKVAE